MKKTNKYQEALNNLKQDVLNCGNCEGDYDATICTTKCLKNKDILTLQELVNKETPQKPSKDIEFGTYDDGDISRSYEEEVIACPNCFETLIGGMEERNLEFNRCPFCGQKLDWD